MITAIALLLFSALPVAHAAPTLEEQALAAMLRGSDGEAIRVLERADDPHLRWIAGRLALREGNAAAARRLLDGPDLGSEWGRIELALANDPQAAAPLALAQMDEALQGTHRDAMARMLIEWADERAAKDPSNASRFLMAAIELEPSLAVQHEAQDSLFRLPPNLTGGAAEGMARLRTTEEPDNHGARLRAATALIAQRPGTAAEWFHSLIRDADQADALAAATRLTGMSIPDPIVLDGLETLAERFPDLAEVRALRLSHATGLAQRDERAGTAALAALIDLPEVGVTALQGWARATSDPTERRKIWLDLATREGASALGDVARREALESLIVSVEQIEDPTERRTAAQAALKTPDGAGKARLLFLALPDGAQRTDALWAHADRFPSGPWCDELAERLLEPGVDGDTAARFVATCPNAASGRAGVVWSHASETVALTLNPRVGGLDVDVATAEVLKVSQHQVDEEALFRASFGHPLDTVLDASLLEADLEWEVDVAEGQAQTIAVDPRGGGRLLTLTIRAGDRRATALVVPQPIDVQIVRRAGDVAIAVLRDGSPVPGAQLWVQDAAGELHKTRTDGRGVARMSDQPSTLRVMARKGGALGFAVSDRSGAMVDSKPYWSLIPWDRGIPSEGAMGSVQVFGSLPSGGVNGSRTLRSLAVDGEVLDEAVVAVEEGVGKARLFLQGGGQVQLRDGDSVLRTTYVGSPTGGERNLRVSFSERKPQPGSTVTATVQPLGPIAPGGIDAQVTVSTPWSTTQQAVSLTDQGATFEVDLRAALGGEPVWVEVQTATQSVRGQLYVASPTGPEAPVLPTTAAVDVSIPVQAPDGSWLLATSPTGARHWSKAEDLRLPSPGLWTICVWDDLCGPKSPLVVADGTVDAKGRWQGPSTLVALTAEGIRDARIVRTGQVMASGSATGTRDAWMTPGQPGPALPVRGMDAPRIEISGRPQRGKTSLDVGSGLPKGSRLWAFLQDASDSRGQSSAIGVLAPWTGEPGWMGDAWSAQTVWSEEIAAALLEEEERLAEISDMKRMDFEFDGAEEISGLGSVGSGMGGGGSGYGSGGLGTRGIGSGRSGSGRTSGLAADPKSLGVLEGARPGTQSFEIPSWVDAVDLAVVARTPDGQWSSRTVRLAVGGGALSALPHDEEPVLPDSWSGDLAELVAVARSLKGGARLHALQALDERSAAHARAPAIAAFALGTDGRQSGVIARKMRDVPARDAQAASSALESLADVRLAERADAALGLATAQSDRARAVAARLLAEPDLSPYARVRAGLALWLAGDADGAQEALQGDNPWIAAARSVVTGRGEPLHVQSWWRTATSEGAHPTERALAIHALSLVPGKEALAPSSDSDAVELEMKVDPPLAAWHGATYTRRHYVRAGTAIPEFATPTEAPLGRRLPISLRVPKAELPTRVACRGQGEPVWRELAPSPVSRWVRCEVTTQAEGTLDVATEWFAPDGTLIGKASASLKVGPAADSQWDDPMSSGEQLGLGTELAQLGNADGLALLESLLATAPLAARQTQQASTAMLTGRRVAEDSTGLIAAFQAYRERVPQGVLDLPTASALAHAYAREGDPERAVAASRVVLDARFKEELGAVRALQNGGLQLTALKLLRSLLDRYPEVPTVVSARFLAPSMLLQRAAGNGDRLGYTRSSLQHTAAAELAGFLILHPDSRQAPEAAAMLTDALRTLGDPARERALAGGLARSYRDGPVAWRLSLAEARAQLESGNARAAVRILDGLQTPGEGIPEVELERGRALDLLGKSDEAGEAYGRSGTPEAQDRAAWLVREDLDVPPLLILRPDMPRVVEAHLRPGSEVTVTAVRVNLESVMLRDGGQVNASAINVQGLRPAANRTLTVGKNGDVPLPSLGSGAYLVNVVTGNASGRMVLVISDAELVVGGQTGMGTFVHLYDGRGNPLVDTQMWLFSGGAVETATTDGAGSAWVAFGGGAPSVLAKAGDRYALAVADPNAQHYPPSQPSPSPSRAYQGLLDKNAVQYDELFEQEANQRVSAEML